MFVNFAFGGQNPSSYPELEDIGRQIMENCCGSPLALRTVGCLLRLKLQVEWDAVLDHLKQNLEDFKTAMNNTLTLSYSSLKLSYDHLSAQIKRCFAYCSIFPSGYEFEKNKLVLLWMAEGLLHDPRGNSRMEDVGDEYFQELLSRSFFQISSGNKSCFVMHDLVSHFAVEVSGRYCCRLEDLGPSVSERTRYLSLLSVKYSFPVILRAINTAKLLRTFLLLDHGSYHLGSNKLLSSLSKLQFLRVLSLSHNPITELPDSISNFKYLRYIGLSHTAIQESVCDLHSLQTLILSFCHSLTELPENIWKLLNLCHLIISGTDLNEMPKKMSSLKYLQTLSYFVVAQKSGSSVSSWNTYHFKVAECRLSRRCSRGSLGGEDRPR